jgi:hypothetical protein
MVAASLASLQRMAARTANTHTRADIDRALQAEVRVPRPVCVCVSVSVCVSVCVLRMGAGAMAAGDW